MRIQIAVSKFFYCCWCCCSCSTLSRHKAGKRQKMINLGSNSTNLVYNTEVVWHSELTQKDAAAATGILLLQLHHPFESIKNVKLLLCLKFAENKWTIQFAAFISLLSGKKCSSCRSSATAAVAAHLNQFILVCTNFDLNKWIIFWIIQFSAFFSLMFEVLQLQ